VTGSVAFDRWSEFINAQAQPTRGSTRPAEHGPVITISRQAGARSHEVAEALVERLQAQAPDGARPWTMFDRDLVETVLEDHHLPDRLAEFMPEDRVPEISDTLDGLFGLHPTSWNLVRKTAETILRLAELGNAVVIGRGASVITGKLPHAFHVRLVGSVPNRVRHVMARNHLDEEAAEDYVRSRDIGRQRYVKKYYRRDIDDPLLYHLVINTDRVSTDEAALIIADAVLARSEGRASVPALAT
jgi:cytidylate kinase